MVIFTPCRLVALSIAVLVLARCIYDWKEAARIAEIVPGPAAVSRRGLAVPGPRSWDEAGALADAALSKMTIEEKHGFLIGIGWRFWDPLSPIKYYYTGNTPAIPRLGIPALKMQDAANGYRATADDIAGSTVSWPSSIALGATWDPDLVEEVASAIAVEFRGKGANVLLGPSIQVHRTVWNGRNFEYLSGEDPYLGAKLTRAYVRGVQGEKVMAVAKHWAFNDQETNRNWYSVWVDERTAFELYYPPFEAAVEEGVCAFMCSYNRVNGTHACNNSDLLQRDLKGRLGFRGFVQTDWGALMYEQQAIFNGLDQEMSGIENKLSYSSMAWRYREGGEHAQRTLQVVEDSARRVLAAIYHLRLDEDAAEACAPPDCLAERLSDQRTPAHQSLAAEAATKSVVLLKNDGVLPVDTAKVRTIALLGFAASAGSKMPDIFAYFGGGSGMVFPRSIATPLDAITERAAREGVAVIYPPTPHKASPDAAYVAAALEASGKADLVIVNDAISSTEQIDRDCTDGRAAFGILPGEMFKQELRLRWADALVPQLVPLGKPVVVLMQTPGAVFLPWVGQVAAAANLFLAGEATGTAWASILFGDRSPEGRLPITFPAEPKDTVPISQEWDIPYHEGLFTSYRNPHLNATFPFGHGLSYTTFALGTASLVGGPECSAEVCARLDVTNSGGRAGTETVQAYLELQSAKDTPTRLLRGFRKTQLLGPGESESILFNFTKRDLSIYQVGAGWVEQDQVLAHFGVSSADIRQVLQLRG